MAKFAKLVVGQTYDVMGVRFVANRPVQVHEDLAEYLTGNSQFQVFEASPSEVAAAAASEENKSLAPAKTERESLIERAAELNLHFAKNISDKKLAAMIAQAEADKEDEHEGNGADGGGSDPLDELFKDEDEQ